MSDRPFYAEVIYGIWSSCVSSFFFSLHLFSLLHFPFSFSFSFEALVFLTDTHSGTDTHSEATSQKDN